MVVQCLAVGRRYPAQIKHDLPVLDPGKAVRSQMIRALLWNDDEVCVGDAVPVNQVADALQGKRGAHSASDVLSDGNNVRRQGVGHVGEMVDVPVRNDETLAGRGWLDGHER